MTELSKLLNEAKDAGRNVDHWVEQAAKAGHDIDRATVFKALKGEHAKNPRESTLQGLAFVFDIDVRDLREAVDKPRGELGPWTPTSEAARLDQAQRDALDTLIKTIVQGGKAHGNAAPIDPTPQGGSEDDNVTPLSDRRSNLKPTTKRRSVAKSRPTKRRGDDDLEG